MRVMHLADLHLGRSLLEQSLIDDQIYILDKIIDIVSLKRVDIVLICGDIYDKSVPSVMAVRLFSKFLTKLYKMNVKVFVIAGNHDSRDRLSFGDELFIDNGIYIEGFFDGKLRCVTLNDDYGELNIYMLPFVKPADVRVYYEEFDIDSYEEAIHTIIKNTDIDLKKRNIIMVHQFVTATGFDVERTAGETISLGGVDNVDVSNFDDFDYVAMGHVHGAQKLLRDTARYAGSPLKYSFSEVFQKKSVPIIDFRKKGDISLELVYLDSLHDMRRIRGNFDNLVDDEVINQGNRDDYIHAILTDEDYVLDAISKLRNVYPNLLRLEYDNDRTRGEFVLGNSAQGDISKKSEIELFKEFYLQQNHIELDDERCKIVQSVIEKLKR